jgi:hypothetical protein
LNVDVLMIDDRPSIRFYSIGAKNKIEFHHIDVGKEIEFHRIDMLAGRSSSDISDAIRLIGLQCVST